MGTEYGMSLSFNTTRELTQDELGQLVNAVAAQIEEPTGLNGDKRASFTVSGLVMDVWHTEAGQ